MSMTQQQLLPLAAGELARFLQAAFSANLKGKEWWTTHVLNELSHSQRSQARLRGATTLVQLDLAALLRVFTRNFHELCLWCSLPPEAKTCAHQIVDMRHASAHAAAEEAPPTPEEEWRAVDAVARLLGYLGVAPEVKGHLAQARAAALARLAGSVPGGTAAPAAAVGAAEAGAPAPAVPGAAPGADRVAEQAPGLGEPAGRVGEYAIYGPGPCMQSEHTTFEEEVAPCTVTPWRVRGPGGLDLTVHLTLFDAPDAEHEAGQLHCESRHGSAQRWDEIVRRLRVGIRTVRSGQLQLDLRTAVPKPPPDRATRNVVALDDLGAQVGMDVAKTLLALGAVAVGTRQQTSGETSRSRNWPSLVFRREAQLPAIASWLITTVLPLAKRSGRGSLSG